MPILNQERVRTREGGQGHRTGVAAFPADRSPGTNLPTEARIHQSLPRLVQLCLCIVLGLNAYIEGPP